ncbi:hypothetical protein [Chlamydiifrater volucris]|uniref:hypothetical protein n=1 Tax=Chlamydiifrater volucris TaxID=2681470 RepID=UPI001BD128D6|nr:hypothetical protein [Chlamydiifrater volucris]
MSVSKPSTTKQSEIKETLPSLREQAAINLQLIAEIVGQVVVPVPRSPESAGLRDQIFFMSNLGYSPKIIAQALSVSGIYLKTLMHKNLSLTETEYQKVLSSCHDLSESSGSGSVPQPPSIPPLVYKEKEKSLSSGTPEEIGETETYSDPEEPSQVPPPKKQKSTDAKEPKKRKEKTRHLTLPVLQEVPQQLPGESHVEETTLQEAHKELTLLANTAETQRQLTILLDTIQCGEGLCIKCPRSSEVLGKSHFCSLCLLAYNLTGRRSTLLVRQLETLLKYTEQGRLIDALIKLFGLGIANLLSAKQCLSNIELARIIDLCKIGDEICLPNYANPASQLKFYESLSNIIDAGLRSPLTLAVRDVWRTSEKVTSSKTVSKLTVLIINNEGILQKITPKMFAPIFSSISFCYSARTSRGKEVKGRRLPFMTPNLSTFLAKLTLCTLESLRLSAQGKSFLTSSPEGPAFPWSVVEHIYSLILLTNPKWKVSILPCQASHEVREELSLPGEVKKQFLPLIKRFTSVNGIHLPGRSAFSSKESPYEET